ncbi:hypothetical protein [Paenisporosarcina sp. OV554]|nr:hypothetical protein [Paenisporosarcina sp. OV554]
MGFLFESETYGLENEWKSNEEQSMQYNESALNKESKTPRIH